MVSQGRAEFYVEHAPPARRAATRQYVYDIGSYHYNWHPQVELLIILGGRVEVNTQAGSRELGRGDVILLNSNEGHATLSLEAAEGAMSAQALLLHVDPDYVASFNDGILPRFACRSSAQTRDQEGFARLRELSARMMLEGLELGASASARREAQLAGILATLYGEFLDAQAPVTVPGDDGDDILRRVVAYVDEHFRDKLTLKDLAQVAGYSPTYFSELFSTRMGLPVTEHVARVRLAEAVRLLGETDAQIADIALTAGFPDVKAFGLTFKRAFAKTASQYRKQLATAQRRGVELDAVDSTFHERFAQRADAAVVQTLRAFARDGARGGHRQEAARARELERTRAELEIAAGQAARLAERLRALRDGQIFG